MPPLQNAAGRGGGSAPPARASNSPARPPSSPSPPAPAGRRGRTEDAARPGLACRPVVDEQARPVRDRPAAQSLLDPEPSPRLQVDARHGRVEQLVYGPLLPRGKWRGDFNAPQDGERHGADQAVRGYALPPAGMQGDGAHLTGAVLDPDDGCPVADPVRKPRGEGPREHVAPAADPVSALHRRPVSRFAQQVEG